MVKIGAKKKESPNFSSDNILEAAQYDAKNEPAIKKTTPPNKEELRALAWCAAQSYSIYKKNWGKAVRPLPSSLIFIKAYKYLKKSKDKVVKKYLSLLNIKFENVNLEEY